MLLIKNGCVINPGVITLQKLDIFVKNGKIAALSEIPEDLSNVTVLDAAGLMVAPGLVDLHVHLRDPGYLYKEDLITGAEAAAAGGMTTVACMPNTSPVIESAALVYDILERSKKAAVNILPYAAVTAGQKGLQPTDAAALIKAGAVGLSDDGMPVMNAALLREVMKTAKALGVFISSHCEDAELVKNYAVNEGAVSNKLQIPGRPSVAEEIMVVRDVMLARDTGAHVHIAHVSTAGSVDIIRKAKAQGVAISAETCPHYFTLTEDEVLKQGPMAKVNPPLRTKRDVAAITEGLADGTIDAIATDHAPHTLDEKSLPLISAPSGISGLETSLALSLTALYHTGKLPLDKLLSLMSSNPAAILGIKKGHISPGDDADIVLFDPDETWTVDPDRFKSKGRNTPFKGTTLRGKVKYTIVSGNVVYKGA